MLDSHGEKGLANGPGNGVNRKRIEAIVSQEFAERGRVGRGDGGIRGRAMGAAAWNERERGSKET